MSRVRPLVVFRACAAYGPAVHEAVAEVAGRFPGALPARGNRVLLKPNLVMAMPRERAGLTDPDLVTGAVLLGRRQGWDMTVGDSPAFGPADLVAERCGLAQACRDLGVPLVTLSGARRFRAGGRTWTVAADLARFDAVVNLPKMKGHQQLYYTGAVKNLYGLVAGKRKAWRHMALGDRGDGFARMLLDTALHAGARLHILDGVVAMEGDGPGNGSPTRVGLVAAATDPVALDLAALRFLGGDPTRDPVLRHAATRAELRASLDPEIAWLGEPLPPPPFRFPATLKPVAFRPHTVLRSVIRGLLAGRFGPFRRPAQGF